MKSSKEVSEFITKLKDETRIYTNLSGIMEKAERDGYLQCVHLTLSNIFQQEMKFAVVGLLIRTQTHKSSKPANYDQKVVGNEYLCF